MNIAQNVERAAIFFPDKTAILFEGRQISYKELNQTSNRLASAFAAHGINKGDRVALYLPNIPAFVVCYLAAVKIGAITVSVNPMLKSEELKYLLNDSGSVLLCTVGELLPNVRPDDYPAMTHVLVCEGDSQGNPTMEEWVRAGSANGRSAEMKPEDPAVLLYTSGTTGFPERCDPDPRQCGIQRLGHDPPRRLQARRSPAAFSALVSRFRSEFHNERRVQRMRHPGSVSAFRSGPGSRVHRQG